MGNIGTASILFDGVDDLKSKRMGQGPQNAGGSLDFIAGQQGVRCVFAHVFSLLGESARPKYPANMRLSC
jgi:hypothetical protein